MDVNKILSSDLLDIVFDGRNKEYGAYELRRSYKKRLLTALLAMFGIGAFIFASAFIANQAKKRNQVMQNIEDVTLTEVKEREAPPPPPPPPPPPKPPEPPKVEIAKFTPPQIVKDEDVKEDEKPPEQEKLDDAKIGVINQEGTKDLGIVAPPVESKSVVEVVAPKVVEEDYDKIFTKVENPAEFPGGQSEWSRYLQKNLRYPDDAIDNGVGGVVRVQFVVDKEGNISEVTAIGNKLGYGLEEEAVRIIKRGPKWKPAEQNGRKVIYRHIQAITFRLE